MTLIKAVQATIRRLHCSPTTEDDHIRWIHTHVVDRGPLGVISPLGRRASIAVAPIPHPDTLGPPGPRRQARTDGPRGADRAGAGRGGGGWHRCLHRCLPAPLPAAPLPARHR